MWKRFKEHAKYSRRWHTGVMIALVTYVVLLMGLPFLAKTPWFEVNVWRQVALFIGVAINFPIASWWITSMQVWEIYVQLQERLDADKKRSA